MMINRKQLVATFLTALCGMTISMSASATLLSVTATIETGASGSLIHAGASPGGSVEPADWLRFDEGQTVDFMYDFGASTMTLATPQSFSLSSDNGATETLMLLAGAFDLNDADGFNGGGFMYMLDGLFGIIDFDNQNYGDSPFNSSSGDGTNFSLYAWGADTAAILPDGTIDPAHDLGMDFVISYSLIPEPGVLVLLLAGMAGLGLSRKMSRQVV